MTVISEETCTRTDGICPGYGAKKMPLRALNYLLEEIVRANFVQKNFTNSPLRGSWPQPRRLVRAMGRLWVDQDALICRVFF